MIRKNLLYFPKKKRIYCNSSSVEEGKALMAQEFNYLNI